MKHHSSLTFNQNVARQLALFSLATLIIGVLGYFGIMGLFRAFSLNAIGEEDWSLLDGFVSVISLSILVGGIAYPIVDRIRADVAEAREKAKLSYDIYQAIFEKLTDPAHEAARRWILSNIQVKEKDEDINVWYDKTHARVMAMESGQGVHLPDGQRAVKTTLNCLDYIGFIAKHYWDIEDDSLDWLSPPISKIWRRIGPYVLQIRNIRKAGDYYVFAEYIGELCIEWRQKRGLGEEEYAKNTL